MGNNFNQIKFLALCQAQGVVERHHAELLLGLVENPNFAGADLAVPAMEGFAGANVAGGEGMTQSILASWRSIMR